MQKNENPPSKPSPTPSPTPSPDEIQKDFGEFIRNKYGGSVSFQVSEHNPFGPPPTAQPGPTQEPIEEENKNFNLDFNYKPKDIKAHLDRFVIKQDQAKKALAIAVCDHYNHVRETHEKKESRSKNYSKQNVVVLGPTGVGKTYLVRHIAELIGVPFVKADATRFSETGYVGSNVDDLVRDLVSQANNNLDLAQYGIVYLDEVDKLASANNHGGKDVSGRGVQIGLLKLMEETDVDLRSAHDMASQMQAFMEFQKKGKLEPKVINTRHILFIVSGAFTGLDEIIKRRLNQKSLGIGADVKSSSDDTDYLAHTSTKDLIDYGFEPEFVGRLPVRVSCQNLIADDLYQILNSAEESIIRQYEGAFRAYGIESKFTDGALRKIAEKAHKQKTGARALMTVLEEILRDFKFELPSTNIRTLSVSEEVISDPKKALEKILDNAHEFVDRSEIREFETDYYKRYGLQIIFDEEATRLIVQESESTKKPVQEICTGLLKSYEHGLNLIKQNTGKTSFMFTQDLVNDPQGTLERLIRDSYRVPSTKSGSPSVKN